MNVGEALLNALKNAGGKSLFGIPGDYVLPFFTIIEESQILPLYTFSHEPAIGYAADAAGRYGGGIGIAVITYGAGGLNMINNVACAWSEKSPLVVISGAPAVNEFDSGLLLHHQIRNSGSQRKIYEEITCASTVLDDPEKAPAEIARVINACIKNSRPVYIELPRNISHMPCEEVNLSQEPVKDNATQLCAEFIDQYIAKSKSPAILADIGIKRFNIENNVAEIVNKTNIPLATTFFGKGMFTENKDICSGTYLGSAGDIEIKNMIEKSDCLIMIGIILSDTNLGVAGKNIDLNKTIRINEGQVYIGEIKFEGIDMRSLIKYLQEILSYKNKNTRPMKKTSLELDSKKIEDKKIRADDIALIIKKIFKENTKLPLAVDMGDCLFISMDIEDVPLIAPGYYATMGFGVPAGLGIQASTGERPLIITGDGGFQMTGWELLNCPRCELDPIVIVLNNSSWGMLKQFQQQAEYTNLSKLSYSDIAKTLGGDGYAVKTTKEFYEALNTAIKTRGKFQLIEVILPKDDMSTTLKEYVSAIKEGMALQMGD